jgi:hypothetical protein
MSRCISIVIIVLFLLPSPGLAKHAHYERWYQSRWCEQHKGRLEFLLPDKTRCDCVTDGQAIEFDFGPKWTEAIGQALYYALQTGKRPGIVLILESEDDYKYWVRLNSVIKHYGLPIETWKIENKQGGLL